MVRRKWSSEEIQEIKALYPFCYVNDLAEKFKVLPEKLKGIAHYYGAAKQKEQPGRPWKIRRVESESSQLNVLDLMDSQHRIGQKLLAEKDFVTAKKLEVIYKSMNEAINKTL